MSFPRYPTYKDSGVEWLGQVPGHWSVESFKRQIERNDGGVWGDDPDGINDILVLRSTEQTADGDWKIDDPAFRKLSESEINGSLLAEDDLLLTKSSGSSLHIGKTTLVTQEIAAMRCCYSNFMQRIRMKSTFLPKLAWHLMNNDLARLQFDLLSNSSTGLANLNARMVGQIVVPVPPLTEQTQIAAFLDRETAKIDGLVTEQRLLMALLKEKRQAVISHAVTQGLNPDAPMKPSGIEWLGDVPTHWRVGAIKYFVLPKKGAIKTGPFGSHLISSDMQSGTIKVYNQRSVIDEDFESGDAFISDEKFEELASFETFPGDLLITTRGTIGRAAILPKNAERGILHPCLLRLQPENSAVNTQFLKTLIQDSDLMKTQLSYLSNATTIEVIYSYTIASVIIPVPPLAEQESIMQFLSEQSAKLDTLTAEAQRAIDLLQERRTALISAAVTGQIDVREFA